MSISGAFGKISMGDNDSAAQAGVGQVAGVGYTGNGDFNEITYIGQADALVAAPYTQMAAHLIATQAVVIEHHAFT